MGTHPIFESDFDCLKELGQKSHGWQKKQHSGQRPLPQGLEAKRPNLVRPVRVTLLLKSSPPPPRSLSSPSDRTTSSPPRNPPELSPRKRRSTPCSRLSECPAPMPSSRVPESRRPRTLPKPPRTLPQERSNFLFLCVCNLFL